MIEIVPLFYDQTPPGYAIGIWHIIWNQDCHFKDLQFYKLERLC